MTVYLLLKNHKKLLFVLSLISLVELEILLRRAYGNNIPLIFASVFFKPLAWAMSIGVLGATLTALLYIPATYIWMKKIST